MVDPPSLLLQYASALPGFWKTQGKLQFRHSLYAFTCRREAEPDPLWSVRSEAHDKNRGAAYLGNQRNVTIRSGSRGDRKMKTLPRSHSTISLLACLLVAAACGFAKNRSIRRQSRNLQVSGVPRSTSSTTVTPFSERTSTIATRLRDLSSSTKEEWKERVDMSARREQELAGSLSMRASISRLFMLDTSGRE